MKETKMNRIITFVKQQQLISFYVLAFGVFWASMPLATLDPSLPIYIGILALSLSAITISGIAEGKPGIKALFRNIVQWRVSPVWYATAIGLPLLLGMSVVAVSALLGSAITTT